MNERVLQSILTAGAQAPSGDNSQPWRFARSGDTISVFNVPGADETLYNFRERGSYLAHGALAENMAVAASREGLRARMEPFPGPADCTVRAVFEPGDTPPDPLAAAVPTRCTNRKPYKEQPLSPADRAALMEAGNSRESVRAILCEDRADIAALAEAVSVNERLLMENRIMHDFLFGIIRWTKAEEERTPGLYLKTMELPGPLPFMFRYVLRHWAAVRFLNRFGFSRFVPKQSAPAYAASSAIGAVIIRGTRNEDFFNAGRSFERLWLTAALRGMSLQPITAIPYLAQRVEENAAEAFTEEHRLLIRDTYASMKRICGLGGGERIAMLFRIGYGEEPSARSFKRPPVLS